MHKFQGFVKLLRTVWWTVNKELSKTPLHQIGQSGGFLDRLFRPWQKTGLPLIGNVLKY